MATMITTAYHGRESSGVHCFVGCWCFLLLLLLRTISSSHKKASRENGARANPEKLDTPTTRTRTTPHCFCWIRFSPTLPRTSKEADLFRFPFTYICTHIYKIEIAYIHMHIPYGLANIIFGMYICMYNVYPTHMYVRYVYGHDGRVILVWKVTKIENNTEIYMAICVSRRRTVARRSDLFFSSL